MGGSKTPKEVNLEKVSDEIVLGRLTPSSSVIHGTLVVFKYDKNKRKWLLEYSGTRESIRRALEPPNSIIRKIRRQDYEHYEHKVSVWREFFATLLERGIKALRGY